MQSNNNGSPLLLAWVNQERKHQGATNTLYNFQHLADTSFIYELLQQVNPDFFCRLNHLAFEPEPYFSTLQEYLIEVEGKKISRAYKKDIIEKETIEEIIKVVLCLLLQSNHKSDFVSRIVEMDVDVQTYLMQEIKKVQEQIENFVQIKDILSTVERLEEENESLKDKLKATAQINEQLYENINQFRNQKAKIQKEVKSYENQKKQVFEELQIVDMKEYVEVYKMMKQENAELNYCLQEIEDNRKEVEQENSCLKEKVSQDFGTISQLNETVAHLKHSYVAMKQEMSCLSTSYELYDSFDDNVLRENKNFNNVKVRNSLETSCSDKHSLFLSHTFDEEDGGQNERLRAYNIEIMHKLDNAYKTITGLTAQVTNLKDEKGKLEKKNVFLEKKLGDLKKEQSRFMKELRKMGF